MPGRPFTKGADPRRHQFSAAERSKGGKAQAASGRLKPFRKGHDKRRHALTAEECRRGGEAAFRYLMEHRPEVLLWLRKRIKGRKPRRKQAAA